MMMECFQFLYMMIEYTVWSLGPAESQWPWDDSSKMEDMFQNGITYFKFYLTSTKATRTNKWVQQDCNIQGQYKNNGLFI